MKYTCAIFIALVLVCLNFSDVRSQTTQFTYQGKLQTGAVAANGSFDLEFRLFEQQEGGSQIGSVISSPAIAVTNGIFSVNLDFGANYNGNARFLEIRVRQAGSGSFETLAPRQQIASTPYAVRSVSSSTADVSQNTLNLGGTPAGQFIVTTDPRLSDARQPLPNSFNYIQNGINQQLANFNINGGGTVGGFFTAGTVNTNNNFTIGFRRILGTGTELSSSLYVGIDAGPVSTGGDNTFIGAGSGLENTTGGDNSFVGAFSGSRNLTGNQNSFFGEAAGFFTTTGSSNSFLGSRAGLNNLGGNNHTLVGSGAGLQVQSGTGNTLIGSISGLGLSLGSFNTYVGFSTRQGSPEGEGNLSLGSEIRIGNEFQTLTNAGAIGSLSQVNRSNSIVLGSISGVNGATANTFVGIGTTIPESKLHVNGGVFVTGPRSSGPSGNGMALSSEAAFDSIQTFANRPLSLNAVGNNVGIGTTDPAARLDVNGTIRFATLGAAGATQLCRNAANLISSCSSSLKYKSNIKNFISGMSVIDRLRPVSFNWINGGMIDLGLGAEDVAKIEPLLVTYNDKGEIEGVKYDRIGVVLINAIKEQQTQIEGQRSDIEGLKQEISALKAILCMQNASAPICGK